MGFNSGFKGLTAGQLLQLLIEWEAVWDPGLVLGVLRKKSLSLLDIEPIYFESPFFSLTATN